MDGVLCDLDDRARLAYLSSLSGKGVEDIRGAIWDSGFESLSDCGQLSALEYLQGFGERIGYPLSKAEWANYRKAGTIPLQSSLSIATEVGKQMKTAVLTNNGHLLKDLLAIVFPELTAIFGHHFYVSAEFSTQKPDEQIFRATCDRIGSRPSATLMIDDRPENIQGAARAGLQTLHLPDPRDLQRLLAELNLIAL